MDRKYMLWLFCLTWCTKITEIQLNKIITFYTDIFTRENKYWNDKKNDYNYKPTTRNLNDTT